MICKNKPCAPLSQEAGCGGGANTAWAWAALRLAAIATALALSGCGGADEPPASADAGPANAERAHTLAATNSPADRASVATAAAGTPVMTSVILKAASRPVAGQGAFVQVRYNGLIVANIEVSAITATDHRIQLAESFDGGMLDIVFTNASNPNGSNARTLTISSITINSAVFLPNSRGVTYDLGHGLEAFDGFAVVSGTSVLTSTGALRIPVPRASVLGPAQIGANTSLSASPGAYVDAYIGADGNPGTPEKPFKTLGRLLQRQLLEGENIHLRCGQQWRESLALGVSQLAKNTRITSYGADCSTAGKPVISGADAFNGGWVRQGQIWSRQVPSGTPKITRMWAGNIALRPAQWPNADEPQALVQATYAPDPWRFWLATAEAQALAGRDIRGATVLLRTQPWRIEVRQVAALGSRGNEVAISTNPEFSIEPGDAWLMRDKLWMLDAPGEFFHDVAAGRLYLIPAPTQAGLDINGLNIEASVRTTGMELRSKSGLQVQGIAFRNAQQDGLRLTDAPGATLRDIESRENGVAGVRLMQWEPLAPGSLGSTVENSMFAANGEFGIDANYVRGATITGNIVLETGVGIYTGPSTAAIMAGPAATVRGNVVDGSAYAGIMFSSQGPTVIADNEISHYCIRLTDCGAIYTWSSKSDVSAAQSILIEGNRIYGAVAASQGNPSLDSQVVAAIYLDDFTQRAIVRRNFLQNMPMGIFLHNASLVTVENNQIWFARRSALAVSMDRTDGDWSTGNVLRNNEIVPMTTGSAQWPALPTFTIAHPIHFAHALAGAAAVGAGRNEFAGNTVIQLNGVVPEHAQVSGPSGVRGLDVATWRQLNPAEPEVLRPLVFSPYYLSLGPEKLPRGQFDGGLGDWTKHWNWRISGYDAQPAWAQAGCTGHCLRLTVAERGDALISPPLSLRAGVPHVYSWTALSSGAAATVGEPYIARQISPWDAMNDSRGFVTLTSRDVKAGQTQRYEAFFTPKSADPATVLLQLETPRVPLYMDAISVREVLGWAFSAPEAWGAAVVAPRDAPRTVQNCAELGWPADCTVTTLAGTPVTLPLTVAARSQKILLWANSPFRR